MGRFEVGRRLRVVENALWWAVVVVGVANEKGYI